MKQLIYILALLISFHDIVYYAYFWQLKEYRLDRMRDYLTTATGKKRIFPVFFLVKVIPVMICLGGYILVRLQWNILLFFVAYFLILISWVFEIFDIVSRIRKKQLFRPDKTVKAFLILFLSGLTIAGLELGIYVVGEMSIISYEELLSIAALPVLAPLILTAWVCFFTPITLLGKKLTLFKARTKIAQMQGLKVIGITGSYGKSSTKEFLEQILATKFKVLKTPGNTNTDVGVAGVILRSLKSEHEVFIVEMGAYKIGEIRKIADLVAPRIGIVTAVKDAHLALFGSLENVKKAKFELVESLPEFGTGIFNLDVEGSADLAERASRLKLKVLGYSTGKSTGKIRPELIAENILVEPEKISFELSGVKFKANLFGKQNVPNLLAAIAAALEIGLGLEEIAEVVERIQIERSTMNLRKISEKLWIINDSYNANPDGVMAGLEYLDIFKGRMKLIVFPGMLELGEQSSTEHKRVAAKIAEVCDFSIFSSRDFEKPILDGLNKLDEKKFCFVVENQLEILSQIEKNIGEQAAVILFVSRGADQVIKKLMQNK